MIVATGSYNLPCFGHPNSGDLPYCLEENGRISFGVIDVSGHGSEASKTAQIIQAWLPESDYQKPDGFLVQLHHFLLGRSSGVAVACCLNRNLKQLKVAGIGNATLHWFKRTDTKSVMFKPGLIGEYMPSVDETLLALSPGDVIIAASDGMLSKYAENCRPLLGLPAAGLAVRLVRDFGRGHDDVSCVVIKCEEDIGDSTSYS